MIKLIINKRQHDMIILYEQSIKLNETEKVNTPEDVILVVSKLLGVNLTGLNDVKCQEAIKNKDTLNKVKNTLNSDTEIKKLIDSLSEKSMVNPEIKLSEKSKDIIKKFNKLVDDLEDTDYNKTNLKLDTVAFDLLRNLNKKD